MTANLRFERGRFFPNSGALFSPENSLPAITALPLLVGVLIGSVIGLYSRTIPSLLDSVPLFSYSDVPASFMQVLIKCLPYAAAAFIFSTGYLGVFFIPLLSLIRGFVFACSVAALYVADAYSGLLHGALSFGVPALFAFPAFLILASDCFRISLSLLPFDRIARCASSKKRYLLHALTVSSLFAFEALYYCLCLPAIL